jgi:UDP-glucose 6-dehydrogenase
MTASAIGTEIVRARRRAVMLVDHDVEADLVAQPEFVEIAVQQAMADLGVVIGVRQHDPQRTALQPLFPGRVVGHLGEIPDAHDAVPR